MKFRILIGLLVLLPQLTLGQKIKKFSSEPDAYLAELDEYFKGSGKKEEVRAFLDPFGFTFKQSGFPPEARALIPEISNLFLRKRMTDPRDWEAFIRLVTWMGKHKPVQLLKPWLEDLKIQAQKNSARFTGDYLLSSLSTLETGVFQDDNGLKWQMRDAEPEPVFEGELIFKVPMGTLVGKFKNDSTTIDGAAGTFYPLQRIFIGQGGTAYFSRVGLSPDSASVTLNRYRIETNKAFFVADSAILNTVVFLKEPAEGRFEERLTSNTDPNSANFPRFEAYNPNIEIPSVVPDVDYKGGFSILGSKMFASGPGKNKAKFYFNYAGKPQVKVAADRFLLRKGLLAGSGVEVTIAMKEDSLFHPKVDFRFDMVGRKLTISRENKGLSQAPFTNTYHKMDMILERLEWTLGDPLMTLGNMNPWYWNPKITTAVSAMTTCAACLSRIPWSTSRKWWMAMAGVNSPSKRWLNTCGWICKRLPSSS
jgi:hypothetical protein